MSMFLYLANDVGKGGEILAIKITRSQRRAMKLNF